MGIPTASASRQATDAVNAFYAEERDHHFELVSHEAIQIMLEVMPPFVTHMRSAFESMQQMMSSVRAATQAVAPYGEMVMRVKSAEDSATALDFGPELTPEETERLDREHPTDCITGHPHHYILNDDHSECPCGGHSTECTTWNVPGEAHPATICGITRTLCQHHPRHLYRQPCSHDPHTSPVGIDPFRARGHDG